MKDPKQSSAAVFLRSKPSLKMSLSSNCTVKQWSSLSDSTPEPGSELSSEERSTTIIAGEALPSCIGW
eukprot:CAMPEP_0185911802 /NCGR_PEP_ID=MMETSP0196C-20130402/33575_1 /TAXON_ID=2932 /ORGANISM="Alexandrium fundyense, Strain CCMP1719" /LENGTH=67 /DNA_ID=CAMNT_0028632923 /DNA_START=13 /DNA_END=213 /DNA_ORIENTATION=-